MAFLGGGASCFALAQSQAQLKTPQKRHLTSFQVRALQTCAPYASKTMVIILPGSGLHGPEEMMPAFAMKTFDGKDAPLLTQFAQAMQWAGFHTLQLGKPGVEFFDVHYGDMTKLAYDPVMAENISWAQSKQYVREAIDDVVQNNPCGATQVVLAGHSEGTTLVGDVAQEDVRVKGLIMLGLQARTLADVVLQQFQNPAKYLFPPFRPFVLRGETKNWPQEFAFPWKEGQLALTRSEYATYLVSKKDHVQILETYPNRPIYQEIWNRPPQFDALAQLPIPIVAFTGTEDIQTPVGQLDQFKGACFKHGKKNCDTYKVKGLTHSFSQLMGPRKNPLLDATYGPVDHGFSAMFSRVLAQWSRTL